LEYNSNSVFKLALIRLLSELKDVLSNELYKPVQREYSGVFHELIKSKKQLEKLEVVYLIILVL